jgi:hypothetical protein
MNEKIRLLFEQAHIQPPVERSGQFAFTPPKTFSPEKFAELIVKECADICNQAILQNQDTLSKLETDELAEKMIIHGSINQAQKLGKGITEHFGVEE